MAKTLSQFFATYYPTGRFHLFFWCICFYGGISGTSFYCGKKAFEIQQGQKKEVTDAEKMNRITEVAYPFVELELLKNKDLTISGIETINLNIKNDN